MVLKELVLEGTKFLQAASLAAYLVAVELQLVTKIDMV